MSTPTDGKQSADLEAFRRGEAQPVSPQRIEAELTSLWQKAAQPGRPLTRACLWNMIVYAGMGDAARKYIKGVVDEITVPARAIVVHAGVDLPEAPIRAWVEANWKGHAGSDEVTLEATGVNALRVASLVRSLLVPDAPTALLSLDALPMAEDPLLAEVDRLIVDTRRLSTEDGLVQLARLAAGEPDLEVSDLGWLGVRPLREMCSSLFDPPADALVLGQLDRVEVVSGVVGTQSRALLMLGWLSSRLGWSDHQRQAGAEGRRRWIARRPDGGLVAIELSTQRGGAEHGVAACSLAVGDRRWSLTRDTVITVACPDLPARVQPARSHSDGELATRALGALGRDAVYREALGGAVQLLGASL